MPKRCVQCNELVPDNAAFCINCGMLVQPGTTIRRSLGPAASDTTAHLPSAPFSLARRHSPTAPARSAAAEAIIALVALCFATIEITGIAQLITQNGWASWDLWPAVLLLSGALLAENDWVNGVFRRGMYGIICWSILPWLLAADQDMTWLMLPALGWWLLWFCDRRP